MSDRYVEVTRQGFFSRIIGSIVGTLFGVVMFVGGFPLLWWNEGRAVRTAKSLEEGAAAVISVPAIRVDPANQGKLVHLQGLATTTEILSDPTFKISANALQLRREVQMYQWVETSRSQTREKLGGSEETVTTYTYNREWTSSVVDSARFKQPMGHQNPGSMRYQSARFSAGLVTLGAFTLPGSLHDDITRSEPVPATAAALAALSPPTEARPPVARKHRKGKPARRAVPAAPAPTTPDLKISGDGFYAGADPTSPAIGDLRITFRRVPPSEVSIIAQQVGASFQPYPTRAGKPLEMLSMGAMSAAQMFKRAEADNMILTWILRLAGFLLMAWGVYSVLRPLAVTASVIPVLGSLARTGLGLIAFVVSAPASLVTIAVAWIYYRPLLGIVLLSAATVVVVGGVLLVRRMKGAAPVRMAA